MRIAVGILCYNQLENKRSSVFNECLTSVKANNPDLLLVADNGSTDGTTEILAELVGFVGFPKLYGYPNGNTCGYGMNKIAATLKDKADIIVLSNDDVVWKPSAFKRLMDVWDNAPPELAIVSGLVQGTYQIPGKPPWNEPLGVKEISGENVLLRRSVPGGAWSYRSKDTDLIFPVSTFPGVDDVPACNNLLQQNRTVGCVDAASHEGETVSTWNNGSERFLIETRSEVFTRFEL